MPRTPVVRDPAHPDFPHGTLRGRARGCTCDDCQVADRKHEKRADFRRAQGVYIKSAPPEKVQQALDHLARLVADTPGASEHVALEFAGLSDSTMREYRTTGYFGPKAVRCILSLTPEALAANVARVPADPVYRQVRQLNAAGYPPAWIERMTGRSNLRKFTDRHKSSQPQEFVSRKFADKVQGLMESHAWRPACPADGIAKCASTQTRQAAMKDGFYPPFAYDEHGYLNLRLLPGHPWAKADDDAGRALDALRASIDNRIDASADPICQTFGIDRRRLHRIRAKLGLHYNTIAGGGDDGFRTVLTPESKAAAAAVRQVLDDADAGKVDRTVAALRLGVVGRRGSSEHVIPGDHPAYLAFQEERRAERQLVEEATAAVAAVELEDAAA